MQIFNDINSLSDYVAECKRQNIILGLVPTMGALHDGHLSLVQKAKENCAKVIVSIFVNPAQFAAGEDLEKYPRQKEEDLEKLLSIGADVVFCPSASDMYLADHATNFVLTGPAMGLESDFRPHFFASVALIVTKLFMLTKADIAVFGEKDYQQLMVVKKLVSDLNIGIKIINAPILREEDGLAMSSRNVYLSEKPRKIAPILYKILMHIVEQRAKIKEMADFDKLLATAKQELLRAGFKKIDYLTIRDAKTLQNVPQLLKNRQRLLVAAHLDGVRLLDNVAI